MGNSAGGGGGGGEFGGGGGGGGGGGWFGADGGHGGKGYRSKVIRSLYLQIAVINGSNVRYTSKQVRHIKFIFYLRSNLL